MKKIFTALMVAGVWLVFWVALLASIVLGAALVMWVVLGFVVTYAAVFCAQVDYKETAVITYVAVFAALVAMTAITLIRRRRSVPRTEQSVQLWPERSPEVSQSGKKTGAPPQGTSPQS